MTEADWSLDCDRCGERYPFGPLTRGCPACSARGESGILELRFAPGVAPRPLAERGREAGLSRYRDLLPMGATPDWRSLGEGGTPLLLSRRIGPRLGLSRLYFKNDTVNPSWSFKDRYVCATLNVASAFGYRRVVTSSTGNLGVSVATYAAAMDMACTMVAPADTRPSILEEARRLGARILMTPPDRRLAVFEELARDDDCFPAGLFLRRPVQNPFGIEGYKTYAYEMIEQLGEAPSAMLFPCARGNGLYGAWKGFREARAFGWCGEAPAMVACQPAGANSLEVSLARGASRAVELPRISSIAESATEVVACDHALIALRESGGCAVSAGETAILEAVHDLASEGLAVEASAALPVACLVDLVAAGRFDPHAPIVCLLTASGLRWPIAARSSAPPIRHVDDDDAERLLDTRRARR